MIQVLCYTGRGFDTCWRPASVATNVVESYAVPTAASFTPIRFFSGDFA